jgi:hypothetical protein
MTRSRPVSRPARRRRRSNVRSASRPRTAAMAANRRAARPAAGMSRANFLRNAGVGAAGVTGAAMMGSGVASATFSRTPPGLMKSGRTLSEVERRGYLLVAVPADNTLGMFEGWPEGTKNDGVIMSEDDSNAAEGLEAEMAKCLAVAIWGEHEDRIRFVGAGGSSRFIYLATKKVDVVYRAATWTATRDIFNEQLTIPPDPNNQIFPNGKTVPQQGYSFCPTYYHDGGNIVMDPTVLEDAPNGSSIEIRIATDDPSTTYAGAWFTPGSGLSQAEVEAEINSKYSTIIESKGLTVTAKLVYLECTVGTNCTADELVGDGTYTNATAYAAGLIEAVVSDGSAILEFVEPVGWGEILFETAVGNEALSPIVREGDTRWRDLVSYVMYALFAADDGWYPPSLNWNSALVPNNPDWAKNLLDEMGSYTDRWENTKLYTEFGVPRGNNVTVFHEPPGRMWYPAMR